MSSELGREEQRARRVLSREFERAVKVRSRGLDGVTLPARFAENSLVYVHLKVTI